MISSCKDTTFFREMQVFGEKNVRKVLKSCFIAVDFGGHELPAIGYEFSGMVVVVTAEAVDGYVHLHVRRADSFH